MEQTIRAKFDTLRSKDAEVRYVAYRDLIEETALALIETETDLKYRKKYAGVWKKK